MTVLFGHPTGNPNSHQAALAHFEAGALEAFCVPWMPSHATILALRKLPGLHGLAERFSRRRCAALSHVPLVQGRLSEMRRLATRALGRGDEGLSYQANDWLMRTMARECARPSVTAVHAYEDCSLSAFQRARELGKACIYDLPIAAYPAWERTRDLLLRRYPAWLPVAGLPSSRFVRPVQKREEIALADLVLVPSGFVDATVREFHGEKTVARATYGVDLDFWRPGPRRRRDGPLRYVYAGQLSLRKGIPLLIEAWEAAALPDARLQLIGTWQLAESQRARLPSTVECLPPMSSRALRERLQDSDLLVLPSFFEGLALVLLEGMACGLPAIASDASGAADVLRDDCGRLVGAGELEQLVDALRWFAAHRDRLEAMSASARRRAEDFTWQRYRSEVTRSVGPFL